MHIQDNLKKDITLIAQYDLYKQQRIDNNIIALEEQLITHKIRDDIIQKIRRVLSDRILDFVIEQEIKRILKK